MILLALDTTSESGSIALVEQEGLREEVPVQSPSGFAHVIFGEIEALLARQGLSIHQLEGFAAASGPGSFTGVRIGLTAVKGLAEATGRKVVAISNLKVLASFGTGPLRAVMIDAKRDEIYGAVYDSRLELVYEGAVSNLDAWLASLPGGPLEFISRSETLLREAMERRPGATGVLAPSAIAAAVGQIALADFERGLAEDPAMIAANYVRRSDAELYSKPGGKLP